MGGESLGRFALTADDRLGLESGHSHGLSTEGYVFLSWLMPHQQSLI